jgi:DNA-binding NarL/FixJ family response regulator
MNVWIHSPHKIMEESLGLLLGTMGFEATNVREAQTQLALWDLTTLLPPYPAAPSLPTLAILAHPNGSVEVLRQHYKGYIRPTDGSAVLKRALGAVGRGEIWAERGVLSQVLDSFGTPQLTAREQQILRLLTEGQSNRRIAELLGVVEGTVKMHVSNLFAKLGVKNRSELLAQALHNQSLH